MFGGLLGLALQLDLRKSSGFKGYHPVLSKNNYLKGMGDMQEGYSFGWEELDPKSNDSNRLNDGAMAGANVWPTELPGFREAILKY